MTITDQQLADLWSRTIATKFVAGSEVRELITAYREALAENIGLRFRAGKVDCPECSGRAGEPFLIGGNPDSLDHRECSRCGNAGFLEAADVKELEVERNTLRGMIDHHRDELNAVVHPAGDGPKRPALCDLVAYVAGDRSKAEKQLADALAEAVEVVP